MATNESVWSLRGLLSAKETPVVDDGRWREGAMVYLTASAGGARRAPIRMAVVRLCSDTFPFAIGT